jgi:hypothetical protein
VPPVEVLAVPERFEWYQFTGLALWNGVPWERELEYLYQRFGVQADVWIRCRQPLPLPLAGLRPRASTRNILDMRWRSARVFDRGKASLKTIDTIDRETLPSPCQRCSQRAYRLCTLGSARRSRGVRALSAKVEILELLSTEYESVDTVGRALKRAR